MESTLAGAKCICVGQNKRRGRTGLGKKVTKQHFNGFTTTEVQQLGSKQPHLLTRKEQLALELYWNARLAAMGRTVDRGRVEWLTYEADVVVLDFFAENKTYELTTSTRERREPEE